MLSVSFFAADTRGVSTCVWRRYYRVSGGEKFNPRGGVTHRWNCGPVITGTEVMHIPEKKKTSAVRTTERLLKRNFATCVIRPAPSLGAVVPYSICIRTVLVDKIYDIVFDTQFLKIYGRPFVPVLYAFLMIYIYIYIYRSASPLGATGMYQGQEDDSTRTILLEGWK